MSPVRRVVNVSPRRVHVLVQVEDVVRVVPALEPDETVPGRAVGGPDACVALVAGEVVRVDAAREKGRHLGEEVADPGGGCGRRGGLEPQRDRGEAVAGAAMAEGRLVRPDAAHAAVEMLEEEERGRRGRRRPRDEGVDGRVVELTEEAAPRVAANAHRRHGEQRLHLEVRNGADRVFERGAEPPQRCEHALATREVPAPTGSDREGGPGRKRRDAAQTGALARGSATGRWRYNRNPSRAGAGGYVIAQPSTVSPGWRRYSNAVTTPKFPPPPRRPHRRSGSSVPLVRATPPAAVTISESRSLSHASPKRPMSQPMP